MAGVAQFVRLSFCIPKGVDAIPGQDTYLGCRFNPQAGGQGTYTRGNQLMFFSCIDVSLSPSLSIFLSL